MVTSKSAEVGDRILKVTFCFILMEEIWKDVVGYEGLYQVSNLGRVRSLDRTIQGYRGLYHLKSAILKQRLRNGGYLSVSLYKNGKKKTFNVHRLVAMAFIPNPNKLYEVNHKDENKTNNNSDNLEWCTHQYNVNFGTFMERALETKTKNNAYGAMEAVNQFDLKGQFIKRYNSLREASRKTNIDEPSIARCCSGKRSRVGGFMFLKDKDVKSINERVERLHYLRSVKYETLLKKYEY